MSTDLTVHDARVLTARIRESVAGVWDLIVEAYTSRAWTSLGYDSWDDYTRTEFDGVRIALPREDRESKSRQVWVCLPIRLERSGTPGLAEALKSRGVIA